MGRAGFAVVKDKVGARVAGGQANRSKLGVGCKERSMAVVLDQQTITMDGRLPAGDVYGGDGFQPCPFPFERLMCGDNAEIEESLQRGLHAGYDAHASAQGVVPEWIDKRRFEVEPRALAARVEFPLEASVLEPADVIRMQMTDVNVGNIEVRKALLCERPANVRTAVDQQAPPAVGDQHHVRLKVVRAHRMRGAGSEEEELHD